MGEERSIPLAVELLPAPREQAPVLANLLELYSHDFSEFIDLRLQPDGRFGYPRLSLYWEEEGRFPFIVKVDGELAGFALVSKGSRIGGDPDVWDLSEFFILRGYRGRGVGSAAARETWRRFSGIWEVRVRESNPAAHGFWKAAIQGFTGSAVPATLVTEQDIRWHVFSFASPGAQP